MTTTALTKNQMTRNSSLTTNQRREKGCVVDRDEEHAKRRPKRCFRPPRNTSPAMWQAVDLGRQSCPTETVEPPQSIRHEDGGKGNAGHHHRVQDAGSEFVLLARVEAEARPSRATSEPGKIGGHW